MGLRDKGHMWLGLGPTLLYWLYPGDPNLRSALPPRPTTPHPGLQRAQWFSSGFLMKRNN